MKVSSGIPFLFKNTWVTSNTLVKKENKINSQKGKYGNIERNGNLEEKSTFFPSVSVA